MISWSKAPKDSWQMFQPSGKGSIWILTTWVQATCNLESIVYITASQLSFKGHYLRHYDSKAMVERPRHPKKTKWTDGRRLATKMKKRKTSILWVGVTCVYARLRIIRSKARHQSWFDLRTFAVLATSCTCTVLFFQLWLFDCVIYVCCYCVFV